MVWDTVGDFASVGDSMYPYLQMALPGADMLKSHEGVQISE